MTIGVIGLGLIGGSMALDLKRRSFADTVIGVENDPVNASAALNIGLVDEGVPFEDCVRRSDVVVVAIPVGAAWAGDHERRDALVEETPFGNGDSVQSQIHYLMIFFILLASLIRDSIFFSSKSAMASRNDFILSR